MATLSGDFITRARLRLFLIIFLFSSLIAVLVSQNLLQAIPALDVGTFASKSIRAPYDFEVVDEAATAARRLEALRRGPSVFDFDPGVEEDVELRLQTARASVSSAVADEDTRPVSLILETSLGPPVGEGLAAAPRAAVAAKAIDAAQAWIDALYERRITATDGEIAQVFRVDAEGDATSPIVIRNLETKAEKLFADPSQIIGLESATKRLDEAAKDTAPDVRALALNIARLLVRPNLRFNMDETRHRRTRAAENIAPVIHAYKKNQLIIGEGHSADATQAMVLDWLSRRENIVTALPRVAGLAFLLSLLVFSAFYVADLNIPDFTITERDFAFLGSTLVVWLLFVKLFLLLADHIATQYPAFPPDFMFFIFPMAAAAMLVRFVMRFEVALTFAVCAALVSGLTTSIDIPVPVYVLVSCLVGAHFMGAAATRGGVVRAGLFVGLANLAMAACFVLMRGEPRDVIWIGLAAFFSGPISGLVVVALTPLAEWLFGYLTPVSLLELANYEHPLLRQIMTRSPGTFQHSVTIGALTEAAAESIGANALLCRVGALFHDAGKSLRPEWFVENQLGDNPHERLNDPVESARIIRQHIPDGVALAREHKIGDRIIDFIREHHGTSPIAFFLAKAREKAAETGTALDESIFYYGGPKPRSRETGILALADAVEAISRTLKDRTPDAMREMIEKTFRRIQDSGQLDDCPLTQRDYLRIRDAFFRVLTGTRAPAQTAPTAAPPASRAAS
ncbi:HDIG domain-containing protein [bacterium]|nr:HDIG domain-containing protein [bacterium]